MKITEPMTDQAILTELGVRIMRQRIDRNLTQAELATQAGVSKSTVERIEAGASAQMSSVIRLFRVLDLLQGWDQLLPEVTAGPMDKLKRQGRLRQRATSDQHQNTSGKKWSWDDSA